MFDEVVFFVNAKGNIYTQNTLFPLFLLSLCSAGDIKRVKLQIAGMGRRMFWMGKELSIDDILAPPQHKDGDTAAGDHPAKRQRKSNKPPKRKKKVWDSQMLKFTVDKNVCYPLVDL